MSLVIEEHRTYLADAVRVAAFAEALKAVVRPTDVVLDLGAGTGILGLLACRAGARHVYAVDATGMLGLAREVWRCNGLEHRVTFLRGASTRVELPERADVVVADQLGPFGIDAGLLGFFADAKRRLLAPDARLVPQRLELFAAPAESAELRERVEFWGTRPAGFDLGPARSIAANTPHPLRLEPPALLGPGRRLAELQLGFVEETPLELRASLSVERDGVLDGIATWFSADLAEGVSLTNDPLAPRPMDRSQLLLPLDGRPAVAAGSELRLALSLVPSEALFTWRVELWVGPPGSSRLEQRWVHSSLRGMPLSSEDLRKTRPDSTPRLTASGSARRTALGLCDGTRPLSEIEAEVFREHPGLFASPEAAAAFVARVLAAEID